MASKNILLSTTILGILTTAAGAFGVQAVAPTVAGDPATDHSLLQTILTVLGLVLAAWGRYKKGDLTILPAKAPEVPPAVPPAAALLLLLLTTTNCAMPSLESGRTGQGGSTGAAPVVNVVVNLSGMTRIDGVSTPTAAPSAESQNSTKQEGNSKVDPESIGKGVKSAAEGAAGVLKAKVPVLGAAPEVPVPEVPVPVVPVVTVPDHP